MGYKNSSWNIFNLAKKVSGPKKVLGPSPGARKVDLPENLSVSKFGFFTLNHNMRPKVKDMIQLWALIAKYMLS